MMVTHARLCPVRVVARRLRVNDMFSMTGLRVGIHATCTCPTFWVRRAACLAADRRKTRAYLAHWRALGVIVPVVVEG